MAEVYPSAAAVTPLDVGERIPDVEVSDIHSNRKPLRELVAMQPSVIIFYRGSWCPYCNRHLASIAEIEDDLKALGFQILAISPDKPDGLQAVAAKNSLGYTLLSDTTATAVQSFGLGFKLDEKTRERYKAYNIDLEKASGYNHYILPVPAVYLVDPEGTITFRYYNPDYKIRLSPEKLLEAAKSNAPRPVQ